MPSSALHALTEEIGRRRACHPLGRVRRIEGGLLHLSGLEGQARLGDRVRLCGTGPALLGEVVQLGEAGIVALPDGAPEGISLGSPVRLEGPLTVAPTEHWLGRILDAEGRPLDGRPLLPGPLARPLRAPPPPAAARRALGPRLATGLMVTDTFLPLVRGQRLGLFAGSGVGKSSLLGQLARGVEAEVVVIALVGERGRELRHFLEEVLGPEGLRRAVLVTATSDQSPLARRQCAWTAMAVAEHFRDAGRSVLLLADSITRFAEAHREVAVAAGEMPVLRGYPPSTAQEIMALCERAGPGTGDQGDITALFSVLVAGSDMEEPVADILRGVLDGHIVLDREIAEGGRFPAIDLLRSTSRSLPAAATEAENQLLALARRLIARREEVAMMLRAGLYVAGSDPEVDQAIQAWPELESFLSRSCAGDAGLAFQQLELALRRAGVMTRGGAKGAAGG